jgi:two-component system cell cycle sensor histidine kinase/response regulator CckA
MRLSSDHHLFIMILRCYDFGMASFERCVVLVADDEPVVLRTVSYALIRHGYDVISAPDGPSAVNVCEEREGPIHLALLDVMMPGMSGPELLECLQRLHPKIAVLFMSGYQAAQIPALASIRDAHFIQKPFLPRALVQRVNEILGNSEVCVLLEDETEAAIA